MSQNYTVAFIALVTCMLVVVACNCYCILAFLFKDKTSKIRKGCGHIQKVSVGVNMQASTSIEIPTIKDVAKDLGITIKDEKIMMPDNSEYISDEETSSVETSENVNADQFHERDSEQSNALPFEKNELETSDEDEVEVELEIVTYPAKPYIKDVAKDLGITIKDEEIMMPNISEDISDEETSSAGTSENVNADQFHKTQQTNTLSFDKNELETSDGDEVEIELEIITYPAKPMNRNENEKKEIVKDVKCLKCQKMFEGDQAMRTHMIKVHKNVPLTSTGKHDIPDISDIIVDVEHINQEPCLNNTSDNTSGIQNINTIDNNRLKTEHTPLTSTRKNDIPDISDILDEKEHGNQEPFQNKTSDNASGILQNQTTNTLSRNNKRRKSGKKRAQLSLTFECSQCENRFGSQYSLSQHNKSKH